MNPGSARTIALAQCFKPIPYEIEQHRNEPWQVLALLPLLNNGSEQVHIILCFYLAALVPVLTYHFIKTLSRLYAEQTSYSCPHNDEQF